MLITPPKPNRQTQSMYGRFQEPTSVKPMQPCGAPGFGTVRYTNRIGFLERYSTKHVRLWGLKRNGEKPMKILIATFAMTLALAFSGPVFAGATAAKTEADCAKAGGTWNATTKMCEEKKM